MTETLVPATASDETIDLEIGEPAAADRRPEGAIRHIHAVMGTIVSFEIRARDDVRSAVLVGLAKACARLDRADAVFSTWKPNSPMSLLRRNELALHEAPEEMAEVLELCATAREMSGGWFDPWALPGGLDPSGLVKGWAADRSLEELRSAGASAAIVGAGGDLATFGRPEPGSAWRIGVRDPWAIDRIACVVESPGAVATSGCYERGDHVVDPTTWRPGTRCASATVTGRELWLADALATGLLVAGDAGLAEIEAVEGYEAYVIFESGAAAMTPAFPIC